MGLSFLAPLFFAGAALLIAPYIIHKIRRPEREPIRFSSVMFIPNVEKEVIERKRIQHILLMLLRMLVLLLLALAFSRPYWRALAASDIDEGPVRHIVLLDTSYSMGAAGVFERAKREARDVLSGLGMGDTVGVMTFGGTVDVAAPLRSQSDPEAGSKESARRAIDAAVVSDEGTSFLTALELAQQQGLAVDADQSVGRLILHVVSDFQRGGMPDRYRGWKLSPMVELNLIEVGGDDISNYAVTDTHVRKTPDGGLRVLGKVRNWSDEDVEALSVRLVVDGKEADRKLLSVKARSARQVSYQLSDGPVSAIDGYIEIDEDDLPADNRRYFTWSPPRKSRVALLADDTSEEQWPPVTFFRQALPNIAGLPWGAVVVAPDELGTLLDNPAERPKVIVVCDPDLLTVDLIATLEVFAETGGQVLLTLDASPEPDALNAALFAKHGVRIEGALRKRLSDSMFDVLSWVDLEHPVFEHFQGTQYNDFSALRFFNYIKIDPGEAGLVLARFDDEAPAMVELSIGEGRMIIWAFAVHLDWTNLPKNARFVPLLYETLGYLSDLREETRTWEVGQHLLAEALVFDESGIGDVQLPGESSSLEVELASVSTNPTMLLHDPGLLRMRAAGASAWADIAAVNVSAAEGDLNPISVAEFQAKVATASVKGSNTESLGIVGTEVDAAGFVIDKEYGRNLILLVFALILIECWYMSALKG